MDAGYDLDEVLDVDRLVSGDDVFFAATGVTDGDLLQGVRYRRRRGGDDGVAGDALALRAPCARCRRRTTASKLRELTGARYG